MPENLTHFPMPGLMVGLTTFNERNEIQSRLYEPGHSWTRNGWVLNMVLMTGAASNGANLFGPGQIAAKMAGSGDIRCAEGYIAQGQTYREPGSFVSPDPGNSTGGLAIGTGNAPFDIDQYDLDDPIPDGSGAGQMLYRAQGNIQSVYDGTSKIWTMTNVRNFGNVSNAAIDVREIGMLWYGYFFYWTGGNFLVARDVLSTPVTVNNGETLEVKYELTFDFSAID